MAYEVVMSHKGKWIKLGIICKTEEDTKKMAELAQKELDEVRESIPEILPHQIALAVLAKLPKGTKIGMTKALLHYANQGREQ